MKHCKKGISYSTTYIQCRTVFSNVLYTPSGVHMTRYRKVELYFEKILRILTKGFLSNLATTSTSSTFVFVKEVHLWSQVVCSNWNGTLLCRYKGICSGGWWCPNFCKSVRHLLNLQCANKLLGHVSAEMLHWRILDQLKPAVEVVRFWNIVPFKHKQMSYFENQQKFCFLPHTSKQFLNTKKCYLSMISCFHWLVNNSEKYCSK